MPLALSPSRPRRIGQRGFTLTEMLAVIVMISILAVAASPVFIGLMRDRRVNRAAFQIVDMVRIARTRALGRNLPIQLAWDVNGGSKVLATGLLTMSEPDVTLFSSARTCIGTYGAGYTGTLHELMRFDVGNGQYDNAVLKFFDDGNVERTAVTLCFSGRGATYITVGGVAARLAGPVSFTVANVNTKVAPVITGLTRRVFIPPNGVARLAL